MLKPRLLSIVLVTFSLCGCISLREPADRGRLHLEVVKEADHWYTGNEILMIPLSGLVNEGSLRSFVGEPGMLVEIKDRLDEARKNSAIKAVVLRIDSPGGTITAADLILHEIEQFKKDTELPVIAILGDTAASGGLYIAMAADEIYALPTTITGSIGVIIELPGIKKLSDKIGLEMRTIKSGPNKDAGSIFKDMTPEERQIFQGLIDQYYGKFLACIEKSRGKKGLTDAELRPLADGRVFSPDVALKLHLIDGIKYPDDVYDHARELADIKDAAVISYEYPDSYRGHIYAKANDVKPSAAAVNLLNIDLGLGAESAPHFLYMWKP